MGNPEKVICQKLLHVSSKGEERLPFCTLLAYNFFVCKFFEFFSTVKNQHKILRCFDKKKKFLSHISTFLKLARNG
jgi:hypothetical protein